ncbi:MAG: hypothetical protein KIS96_06400 [Bauldia sp.]|nr:hypothetical protein [Bauldia sp.]
MAAVAGMSLALGFATGALAQNDKPPPPQRPGDETPPQKGGGSSDLVQEALHICGEATDGLEGFEDFLIEDGWTIDGSGPYGPYMYDISANKTIGEDIAYFYAMVEYFNTTDVGYCSFEVDFPIAPVNIAQLDREADLLGSSTDTGDGYVFGAWESFNEADTYYVSANQSSDLFHFQVTWTTFLDIEGGFEGSK